MYVHGVTDSMRKLFKEVHFSERGSNSRIKEKATYMTFVDYLEECGTGGL